MAIGTAALQALAGVVLVGLSFVFRGVVSRPMIVAGVVCLALAWLSGRREERRQIRVFMQAQRAIAALVVVVLIGLVGAWSLHPAYRRHMVLGQLEMFSNEGRQIQGELAQRVASSNQLMGDYTARIQEWHHRLEAWIDLELGPFYRQRLGTPKESLSYPPQMPARLRVFWDITETDLSAMEVFQKELSSWLF